MSIICKDKGNRRERQARDILRAEGFEVVKAGGSLGVWDLVAIRKLTPGVESYLPVVRFVQVKSNSWPRPAERVAMLGSIQSFDGLFVRGEAWRFDDGSREPKIRMVNSETKGGAK